MVIRRSSKTLIAIGVLLLLAAAAIRFVVVPIATKLPGDLDSTAHYEGTADLLNPEALQVGDLANAIATGVPITIDRHVYVSSTSGDTAITHDDTTVHTPAGSIPNNHTYALNRSTLDSAPSTDPSVESHSGLTISLPLHPPLVRLSVLRLRHPNDGTDGVRRQRRGRRTDHLQLHRLGPGRCKTPP